MTLTNYKKRDFCHPDVNFIFKFKLNLIQHIESLISIMITELEKTINTLSLFFNFDLSLKLQFRIRKMLSEYFEIT